MSGRKRKHETLTLNQKLDILQKVDNGVSYSQISALYNVGRSTVYDLRKNRDKIENYVKTANVDRGRRLTMKTGYHLELEETLYQWYLETNKQEKVNSQMLRDKALDLYEIIYKKNDFKASDGWLTKFKQRFGIRLSERFAEKLENIDTSIDDNNIETIAEDKKLEIKAKKYEEMEQENEDNIGEKEEDIVSSEEALVAIETCIKWAQSNIVRSNTLSMLQKLKKDINFKITSEKTIIVEPRDFVVTVLESS